MMNLNNKKKRKKRETIFQLNKCDVPRINKLNL